MLPPAFTVHIPWSYPRFGELVRRNLDILYPTSVGDPVEIIWHAPLISYTVLREQILPAGIPIYIVIVDFDAAIRVNKPRIHDVARVSVRRARRNLIQNL